MQDTDGNTTLIEAAVNGCLEIVKVLVRTGANVNLQGEYGWTALMHAAWNCHEEIVELLLQANSNVNVQDKDGMTVLDLAKTEVIKTLVKQNLRI